MMDIVSASAAKRPYVSIDPRSKFLLIFSAGFTAFSNVSSGVEAAFIVFLALLLINAKQSPTALKASCLFLAVLLADYFALAMPSGIGKMAAAVILRMVRVYLPIYLSFLLMIKTTAVSEFIAAFYRMRVTPKIVIPFSVMFRFIPTVKEEWHSIRNAMKFRGIGLGVRKVLFRPLITMEYVMVPLLMSSSAIANELAAASLSRGLDSEKERSCLTTVRLEWADCAVLAASIAFIACAIWG